MRRQKKNESGITLVALVITIIILLILAGIAIVTLTQTGLFENAKQAKKAMENAQNTENNTLVEYEGKIDEIVEKSSRENNKISVEYKNNFKFNKEYVNAEESPITVAQYGNVVTVTGVIKLSAQNDNGCFLYLEDLPNPIEELYFVATDENAQKINFKIEKNGKMYNYWSGNTISQGKQIRFSITYICE